MINVLDIPSVTPNKLHDAGSQSWPIGCFELLLRTIHIWYKTLC